MGDRGSILAVDKYESKLNLIKTGCERLGIRNVEAIIGDANELQTAPADRVLVDVPCSGLGVLRKKPDMKWKREPDDIPRLARQQLQLLESAARLLKPGGVIVYSTCTTEPEENGDVVRKFLALHPGFRIDHAANFVNKSLVSDDGCVETLPHRHHIDGSFAARLVNLP